MTRKVRRVIGVLDPTKLYTTEGAMRFGGMGRETLALARRSGKVRPIDIGRRTYYRGDELIEWIKSKQRHERNRAC